MKLATMMLILLVPVIAACGRDAAPDASEAAEDSMPSMPGMGMEGMQEEGGDMMARMGAHMQMMQSMRGDSLHGLLPTHRPMVANMIASMNREMSDMNMPADEAWSATVDSLRDDLVAMPEMDAAQLEAMMPAHYRRVTRLMEMHREMMSGMEM